ncbi:unnamed protein product, partial [Effrenium voratum]
PAVSVNYEHPDILVNPPGVRLRLSGSHSSATAESPDIAKEKVINRALRGETMEPKTTQHLVREAPRRPALRSRAL